MLNNFLYNQAIYNQTPVWIPIAPQDDIVYNSYWLKNSNIIVTSISNDNWHSITSETYSSPLTDLWGELNYYFKNKTINLEWFITTNTSVELNQRIDELKKILWQNNKYLDIKVDWTIRRAKASCTNLDSLFDRQNYNITFIPFRISFRLVSEFSKELTSQSQSLTWKTASFTEEKINYWTVRANPVLSILLNSVTSVTSISFAILTNTITVLDTYSASDVIQIDCQEKTVKINSISVDYTWTFPVLEVWTNSYIITVTWTAKNFNTTLTYFNNYL